MISRLMRRKAVQTTFLKSLRSHKYYYGTDDHLRYTSVKEPQELIEYFQSVPFPR